MCGTGCSERLAGDALTAALRLLRGHGKAADQFFYDPVARNVFFQIVEDERLDSLGSSLCNPLRPSLCNPNLLPMLHQNLT